MEHVTRYVVTMPWPAGGKGWRTLAHPGQGRHTFETAAEARAWIEAARANTAADTLRSAYGAGGADALAVCPCACWTGHHDPVGVYFPPGSEVPDETASEQPEKPKTARVTVERTDADELYFMLRGRGGSALKSKLLAALRKLDPKSAAELDEREKGGAS